MNAKEQMEDFKKTYQIMKARGPEDRIAFLESVVSYCEFLGMNHEKKMMFLAFVRNVLPNIGQSFTECEGYDDVDIKFNQRLKEDSK